jgi:hypothetical protein
MACGGAIVPGKRGMRLAAKTPGVLVVSEDTIASATGSTNTAWSRDVDEVLGTHTSAVPQYNRKTGSFALDAVTRQEVHKHLPAGKLPHQEMRSYRSVSLTCSRLPADLGM